MNERYVFGEKREIHIFVLYISQKIIMSRHDLNKKLDLQKITKI